MLCSDISHLPDEYSKAIHIKLLISAVPFDTFNMPFLLVDFDWFRQIKCQHVMDQTNFFMFPVFPGKLGRNLPDKMNVFLCMGEAIHQNAVILLPDRKQTLMLLSACAAFHFAKEFVNYLDTLSLSVHAGWDSWSRLLWARNLLFSVRYIAMSHFQLCLSFFFRFSPRKCTPYRFEYISFRMWITSADRNYNKSNSLMQYCSGKEGGRLVTAAKSTAVPQSIRSVKSISLCMFALVCNNYNLHPKQAW